MGVSELEASKKWTKRRKFQTHPRDTKPKTIETWTHQKWKIFIPELEIVGKGIKKGIFGSNFPCLVELDTVSMFNQNLCQVQPVVSMFDHLSCQCSTRICVKFDHQHHGFTPIHMAQRPVGGVNYISNIPMSRMLQYEGAKVSSSARNHCWKCQVRPAFGVKFDHWGIKKTFIFFAKRGFFSGYNVDSVKSFILNVMVHHFQHIQLWKS